MPYQLPRAVAVAAVAAAAAAAAAVGVAAVPADGGSGCAAGAGAAAAIAGAAVDIAPAGNYDDHLDNSLVAGIASEPQAVAAIVAAVFVLDAPAATAALFVVAAMCVVDDDTALQLLQRPPSGYHLQARARVQCFRQCVCSQCEARGICP